MCENEKGNYSFRKGTEILLRYIPINEFYELANSIAFMQERFDLIEILCDFFNGLPDLQDISQEKEKKHIKDSVSKLKTSLSRAKICEPLVSRITKNIESKCNTTMGSHETKTRSAKEFNEYNCETGLFKRSRLEGVTQKIKNITQAKHDEKIDKIIQGIIYQT